MESINFAIASLHVFMLMWARMLAMFLIAPMYASASVLVRLRVTLAFFVTLVIAPEVVEYTQNLEAAKSTGNFLLLLVKEFLLGATMGFFLTMIFFAFQMSAQFFSTQIGLSVAQVFDAATNTESSLFGFFFNLIAILIFISINGPHLVIRVIAESYKALPVIDFTSGSNNAMLLDNIVSYFSYMFVISLKLSFPIIATSIILIVGLGIIGRVIPQANILMIGLPIQLSLGFLFVLFSLPFMVRLFGAVIENVFGEVFQIASQLGPNPSVVGGF